MTGNWSLARPEAHQEQVAAVLQGVLGTHKALRAWFFSGEATLPRQSFLTAVLGLLPSSSPQYRTAVASRLD